MTYTATLQNVIEIPWTSMELIRIGRVPAGLGEPSRYLLIEKDGVPALRVDVYLADSLRFKELIVWNDFVLVGLSSLVHVIDPSTRRIQEVPCEGGFFRFFPLSDCILIATDFHLIRLDAQCQVSWRCLEIGINGIDIRRIVNKTIYGNGGSDPRDGLSGFEIDLETGRQLRRDMDLCWV